MTQTVKEIPINRMDCPTCIPLLEKTVLKIEGVSEARGNYMTKILRVTYDQDRVQLAEIEAAIERVGYHISYKKYPGVISKLRSLFRREQQEKVLTLTDADFPGKVLQAPRNTAVLFSSQTCPVCRVFKSQFQKIGEKVEGKADLYEMDIASTKTWRDYDILTIPTVLIFRAGEVSERFTALPRAKEIERSLRT